MLLGQSYTSSLALYLPLIISSCKGYKHIFFFFWGYTHIPRLNTQSLLNVFTSPSLKLRSGNLRTQKDLQNSVVQVSSECFRQWVHVTRRFPNLAGQQSHIGSFPGPFQTYWIKSSASGAWAFISYDFLKHICLTEPHKGSRFGVDKYIRRQE